MEWARYFRPEELAGVEALHASFVSHEYRPHSRPTWTIAVMRRGAARFTVDGVPRRAGAGQLFVLEPETVHTGMPGAPDGWAYEVLHLAPSLIAEWGAERRSAAARCRPRRIRGPSRPWLACFAQAGRRRRPRVTTPSLRALAAGVPGFPRVDFPHGGD